jgi:hypothetical protein
MWWKYYWYKSRWNRKSQRLIAISATGQIGLQWSVNGGKMGILWWYIGSSCTLGRPWCEAEHSHPSRVKAKHGGATVHLPHIPWCLLKHTAKFTLIVGHILYQAKSSRIRQRFYIFYIFIPSFIYWHTIFLPHIFILRLFRRTWPWHLPIYRGLNGSVDIHSGHFYIYFVYTLPEDGHRSGPKHVVS